MIRLFFLETINKAFAAGGELEIEYRYKGSSGQKRIWTRGVVELSEGKPASIKGTIRDITKKYNLIQQLLENDYLYKQAQELTLLGNWSWTLSSGKLFWSDEMYKIYDVEKGTEVTLAQAISYINPEYQDKVKRQLDNISENREVPREEIYKITTKQGIEKILLGVSKVETDNNNIIIRIYGTCQDITHSQILKEVMIS